MKSNSCNAARSAPLSIGSPCSPSRTAGRNSVGAGLSAPTAFYLLGRQLIASRRRFLDVLKIRRVVTV